MYETKQIRVAFGEAEPARVVDAVLSTEHVRRHPYRVAEVDESGINLGIPVGESYTYEERMKTLYCRIGSLPVLVSEITESE